MGYPLILFILFFGLSSTLIQSNPNTNISQVLCNGQDYSLGNPFGISQAYVLNELQMVTPHRQGYDFYDISPYPNALAYGHAHCNKNLTSSDCGTCLRAAKVAMDATCVRRIGARSVLVDCGLRYEQYPFEE